MIEKLIKIIREKKDRGSKVFVCGNGGSAANAEHFANDLISRGVKATCLGSNVAVITMIANDYGYEYIFSKQLEVLADPDDLLIMISCSGTSPNILEAEKINIDQFKMFGGEGTYGDKETEHQNIIHKVVEGLGPKVI